MPTIPLGVDSVFDALGQVWAREPDDSGSPARWLLQVGADRSLVRTTDALIAEFGPISDELDTEVVPTGTVKKIQFHVADVGGPGGPKILATFTGFVARPATVKFALNHAVDTRDDAEQKWPERGPFGILRSFGMKGEN